MKSLFRATAILGSSSLITIIVGLATSKAYALLLGPSGLGFMGLLQSLLGLSSIIAGLGVGSGLVRMGANALARNATNELAALRRAAWLLFAIAACLGLCVLTLFRAIISEHMLGTAVHANSVVLLGVALAFSLAAAIQGSTLNAHHRVGALAKIAIINSVAAAGISLILVARLGERGIAWALIGGAAMSLFVSSFFLRREVTRQNARPTRAECSQAIRSLLRFGLPFTASALVGTGVQLLLPIIILHLLNQESVGFYRAAVAISVGYIGFLLTAMAQDYYPRLSAVSHEPEALARLVNEQHQFVMLLGVPLIMTAMALAPYIIPLIYSPRFYPAEVILKWQLAGSLLKFSSWTMSFVILARSGSTVYFLVELVAGVTTLCATWLGIRWFGLAGLGIGFCISYLIYYGVVWLVIRREINFEWKSFNKQILIASAFAAGIVLAMPLTNHEALKTSVNFLIALLSICASSYALLQRFGGLNTLRMRLSTR
jgi:PST family polysaccharide transporter